MLRLSKVDATEAVKSSAQATAIPIKVFNVFFWAACEIFLCDIVYPDLPKGIVFIMRLIEVLEEDELVCAILEHGQVFWFRKRSDA